MAQNMNKRRGPYRKYESVPGSDRPRTTKWRVNRSDSDESMDKSAIPRQSECIANHTSTFHASDSDMSEFDNHDDQHDDDDILNQDNDVGHNIHDEMPPDKAEKFADDEVETNLDKDSDTEDTPELSDTSSTVQDEPLYAGARITLVVSMILIITFVMRHQLSGEAMKDLLILTELHCLTPNLCKRSVHLFNKFFTQLSSPVQTHYFCDFCKTYHGAQKEDICPACQKSSPAHFMYIPVVAQVQSILTKLGPNIFQHRINRQKQHIDNIEDVYDGNVYTDCFENEHFHGTTPEQKENELHISFQLNTDGVAIFRCSSYSVWPCYLTINELPAKLRFSSENRIFAGLWYGKSKPEINVFFLPLAKELNHLYEQGTEVDVGSKKKMLLRAVLLSLVCDAPARCITQNFIQFNGYFGCGCCLANGVSVKTSERGQMMSYPYDISQESAEGGHAEVRSHNETLGFAKHAEETGRSQKGVKGYSVLYSFKKFDVINCVTVDYMHCVLLGVMKMLLHLWTDTVHKKEKYYIGDFVSVISDRMKKLTPPNLITRVPRSLDDLKLWKASEYKSFLLFHAFPSLTGILAEEYLSHFLLLSEGIFLLSQTSISRRDLVKAKLLLKKFCASIDLLYAPRYETSNVHALLHLVEKVESHGPLWCHSCFFYEDLNGDLRSLFHGSQKVELQISLAVIIQQQVPLLVSQIPLGSEADIFYQQLKGRAYSRNCAPIEDNIFAVGSMVLCQLSPEIRQKAEAVFGPIMTGNTRQFQRILSRGVMYHSKAYIRVTRRNSYTVLFSIDDAQHIGQVQCYLQFISADGKVLNGAVINLLKVLHSESSMPCHLSNVVVTKDVVIVPVSNITDMCVFMSLIDSQHNYVAKLPNIVESD